MPDPKTPALRAPAQIIEPDKLKAAAARAQEEFVEVEDGANGAA